MSWQLVAEVQCDGCEFLRHFPLHFPMGERGITDLLREHGWVMHDEGGHYCPRCVEEAKRLAVTVLGLVLEDHEKGDLERSEDGRLYIHRLGKRVKNEVDINTNDKAIIKCPICHRWLDPHQEVDNIILTRDGWCLCSKTCANAKYRSKANAKAQREKEARVEAYKREEEGRKVLAKEGEAYMTGLRTAKD